MKTIVIPDMEYFDETKGSYGGFQIIKGQTIQIEHSLLSISKWESIYHKPYLGNSNKTPEELMAYIKCMTITPNVRPEVYSCLTQENVKEIVEYIEDPSTATWFSDDKKNSTSKEIITSEVIYYWMIANNIPVQFEKWHINRLLTLIKVCSEKNKQSEKMSKQDVMARHRALNAERRAKYKKG